MEARLDLIDLTIPLGKFTRYHDEGFVESVIEETKILCKKYNKFKALADLRMRQLTKQELPSGGCLLFKKWNFPFRTRHFHIFYEKLSEFENIVSRAHEEAHVIDKTDNLKYLEEKIISDGFHLVVPLMYLDSERKADLASIYILLKKGYSKKEIQSLLPYRFNPEDFSYIY